MAVFPVLRTETKDYLNFDAFNGCSDAEVWTTRPSLDQLLFRYSSTSRPALRRRFSAGDGDEDFRQALSNVDQLRRQLM